MICVLQVLFDIQIAWNCCESEPKFGPHPRSWPPNWNNCSVQELTRMDSLRDHVGLQKGVDNHSASTPKNYTHVFARHLSRIVRCSLQVQEQRDHEVHDLCHATDEATTGEPEAKRRRPQAKSPAETLYEPLRKVDPGSSPSA